MGNNNRFVRVVYMECGVYSLIGKTAVSKTAVSGSSPDGPAQLCSRVFPGIVLVNYCLYSKSRLR